MSELKACPFCGGNESLQVERQPHGAYYVECYACWPAHGPSRASSRADAIAAWNTRALAPALATVIEAVEAQIKKREEYGLYADPDWYSTINILRDLRDSARTEAGEEPDGRL